MKTLLFCTCYLGDEAAWPSRYRAWLDHVAAIPLRHDVVFLIDDGSAHLPRDPDVAITSALPDALDDRPVLFHFEQHIGRNGHQGFPGWLRGFFASFDVARKYGCDKIVHLESDARLLSARIVDYINGIESGWTALWCPLHNMPESAIQVICADRFDEMEAIARDPIAATAGCMIELALPFTNIEMSFMGDRYGEFSRAIPVDADYACQFACGMAAEFRMGDAQAGAATPQVAIRPESLAQRLFSRLRDAGRREP